MSVSQGNGKVIGRGRRRLSLTQTATLMAIALAVAMAPLMFVMPGEEGGDVSVEVEGAILLSGGAGVVARAISLETRVVVEASGGQEVTVELTNVDPTRTEVDGLPDGATVASGPGSIRAEFEVDGTVEMRTRPSSTGGCFTFYAIGDTQGYGGPLAAMVEDANQERPAFVLHLGDITASGEVAHFEDFMSHVDALEVPIFTTPGNHDAKGDIDHYRQNLAPDDYWFSHGEWAFVSVSSSGGGPEEGDLDWLETVLAEATSTGLRPVVFTHVPPLDVVVEDHSFDDPTVAARFIELMAEHGVEAVFNGHDHLFNVTEHSGVPYYTSGGGGAALYANGTEGGFHHYLRVTVGDGGLEVGPVPLPAPERSGGAVELRGPDGNLTLSLGDLMALPPVSGRSSFENSYGNWRGHGNYTGVALSTLVDLVGGMGEGDHVRVVAGDGYSHTLGCSNVHPGAAWQELQGDAVLAYAFDRAIVPEWVDGPRLVFLPPDGAHSSSDAAATSGDCGDTSCSAGAWWVRDVRLIEVL